MIDAAVGPVRHQRCYYEPESASFSSYLSEYTNDVSSFHRFPCHRLQASARVNLLPPNSAGVTLYSSFGAGFGDSRSRCRRIVECNGAKGPAIGERRVGI